MTVAAHLIQYWAALNHFLVEFLKSNASSHPEGKSMQFLVQQLGGKHRLMNIAGLFVGMTILGFSTHFFQNYWTASPWIAAPLAASAFILFIDSESPFAKPKSVIVGNMIAGATAVTFMNCPDLGVWSVPVVVSFATLLMALFGALHPPACAVALLIVVRHISDYSFIFFPVVYGAIVLVMVSILFNRLRGG